MTGDLIPVIGLEVHAQLQTRSKMFCSCSATYANAPPNTHVCNVCSGMPGSLPVINRKAVDYTLLTALALHCQVQPVSKFDRKNYSYPDLPKGYQISQYDQPVGVGGHVEFVTGHEWERCGITRVHLEEDTGKITHVTDDGRDVSLIDYNRCGVPLMEIVSEPDLNSPAAARDYFASLRQILMYLGVCDGNLQEGSMRADVNVSLHAAGEPFGTKVEIKNLNSFRAVQRALEYEIERQRKLLKSGGIIEQETRGWSEAGEVTLGQRSKEYAHDYRYFPEPDLPVLTFTSTQIEDARRQLPELPSRRSERFEREFALSRSTASVLTADRSLADYFEAAVTASDSATPGDIGNWVTGDFLRLLNERGLEVSQVQFSPDRLGKLADLVRLGTISNTAGKQVLEKMFDADDEPEALVEKLGLRQVSDVSALEAIADEVIAKNGDVVADYRKGKGGAINRLLGAVMKASGGSANARIVREVLQSRLGDPGQ